MLLAFEIAHFYGWSLDVIRSMSMDELNIARDYMNDYIKRRGGENGK